jgi:simple sugar transport system permease protein
MAPLLLIAVGLIFVFRANIWNLGYDGQFLLAAAVLSGWGPSLVTHVPLWLAMTLLFLVAAAVGAAWTIVPAVLKAGYETNEIITTLMMSFIGVGLANILVKGPFQDPSVNIPQTKVLPLTKMLPAIPGTRIHCGVLVALFAAIVAYYVLTRTAFGLRVQVVGANPRAARHVGVQVRKLILSTFLVSGALIGAAAAADILGVWGYARANWNPAYGDTVIPFVFLARLNPLGVIPFIAFFAVLSTGGDLAAQNANLPTDFLLVLVALILLFMTLIEFVGRRRELGQSYIPEGMREVFRKPLIRRRRRPEDVRSTSVHGRPDEVLGDQDAGLDAPRR